MYGQIEYDLDGYPICEICGKSFKKVIAHVWQKHGLSAKKYKKKFGFDLQRGIMCKESVALARKRNKENYDLVVKKNLITDGTKTRFNKGHGRKKYCSEQTRLRMIKQMKDFYLNNKK